MQSFYNSKVTCQSRNNSFGAYAYIIIFQGMETVTGRSYFAKSRQPFICENAYERRDARGTYHIVRVSRHIIRQYMLVVDHGIQLKVIRDLKAKIAERIVALVIGTSKYASLVHITQRHIVVGPVAT